jgi:hypothetical protein
MIPGIEVAAAPARRGARIPRPITLAISNAERLFILHRIKDVAGTAEAVVHSPAADEYVSPWTRQQAVSRILAMVQALRKEVPVLLVISNLDKAILVNAIEANPYFADMHDADPRLTVDAVRQANTLRERLARALGVSIKRVPLGAGRTRISEKNHDSPRTDQPSDRGGTG